MKSDSILKHVAAAFAGAALIYVAAFYAIEYFRGRNGPWQVTFQFGPSGEPALLINEPGLGISSVTVLFPGQQVSTTNLPRTVVFDRPITNAPFGSVRYLDTTFLPGAVVFDLFGHEIQLLPRVLMIDRREVPWQNGSEHRVRQEPHPSPAPPLPGAQ
jgi:hypothetical protein